jgi:hypothetical protein
VVRHPPVLSQRALNRALLARQGLLARTPHAPAQLLEALIGLQAQTPQSPYLALWSRIEGFDPAATSALLRDRRTVRMTLMRTTIHLVTAADALRLRPVLQDVMERGFRSGSPFGRRLAGVVEVEDVLAVGSAALDERAMTAAELRTVLAERWPHADAEAMAQACRYLLPLAHVPPRGLWREAGLPRLRGLESWLGEPAGGPPPPDASPDSTILRYLAAFGPASVADARAWSWLAGLREAFERLRPYLRTFRDEGGRELFDVPVAPLPDPDTPAPPRFLPDYDNLYLSHADRSRVVGASGVPWERWEFGSLSVDGMLRATWRHLPSKSRSASELRIRTFEPLSPDEEEAVRREGEAMVAFLDPAVPGVPVEIRIEPHPDLASAPRIAT